MPLLPTHYSIGRGDVTSARRRRELMEFFEPLTSPATVFANRNGARSPMRRTRAGFGQTPSAEFFRRCQRHNASFAALPSLPNMKVAVVQSELCAATDNQ